MHVTRAWMRSFLHRSVGLWHHSFSAICNVGVLSSPVAGPVLSFPDAIIIGAMALRVREEEVQENYGCMSFINLFVHVLVIMEISGDLDVQRNSRSDCISMRQPSRQGVRVWSINSQLSEAGSHWTLSCNLPMLTRLA